MSTLLDMVNRITDELARDDLNSQIRNAINDAIKFYNNDRFEFNETRDLTFNTVASQEFYGAAANAAIPTLRAFDYLILYVGTSNVVLREIRRRQPLSLELLNASGNFYGQPHQYAFYNKQIRLSPIPDSVMRVRIAGRISYAAPASDSEADNPWMNELEALIRKRAKYELALNVTKDVEEAKRLAPQIRELYDNLTGAAARISGTGIVDPMQF